MIAIIDYGAGNLFSLCSSFRAIGQQVLVTSDPEQLRRADRVLLPGVGAYRDATEKLQASGLDQTVRELVAQGKPLMGICLGMQLLFDRGYEYGQCQGLGLLRGSVLPLEGRIRKGLKVPHIGWNRLNFRKDSRLFRYIKDGDFVYFVHSYYASDCEEVISATAEYDLPVPASVEQGNLFGCQFHPEKSGQTGLNILRAFCEI